MASTEASTEENRNDVDLQQRGTIGEDIRVEVATRSGYTGQGGESQRRNLFATQEKFCVSAPGSGETVNGDRRQRMVNDECTAKESLEPRNCDTSNGSNAFEEGCNDTGKKDETTCANGKLKRSTPPCDRRHGEEQRRHDHVESPVRKQLRYGYGRALYICGLCRRRFRQEKVFKAHISECADNRNELDTLQRTSAISYDMVYK